MAGQYLMQAIKNMDWAPKGNMLEGQTWGFLGGLE
jgi:hypothetical protein